MLRTRPQFLPLRRIGALSRTAGWLPTGRGTGLGWHRTMSAAMHRAGRIILRAPLSSGRDPFPCQRPLLIAPSEGDAPTWLTSGKGG